MGCFFMHAHCTQGKRRVQGVRPPYSWNVPFLDGLCEGIPGAEPSPDWARGFEDLYSDLAPRVAVWLWAFSLF